MSEQDTDLPLDSPPSDFHHTVYESLDPEKPADPLPFDSGREGLEQAADEFSHQTKAERGEVTERTWGHPEDWSKHAPGNYQVSAEHAADMLAETRKVESQIAQLNADDEIAKAIDNLRAGDEMSPSQVNDAARQPDFQPQPEAAPAEPSELDRLLAPLPPEQRPHFVAAFNQMVDQTRHQAATEYQEITARAQAAALQNEQAAAQAMLRGEALLLSQAPELAGVPREQRLLALDILEKQNPSRAAAIRALDRSIGAHLQNETYQLRAAQQRQIEAQQQQQRYAAERFQHWAAREDEKVDKLLAAEPPERRSAIMQEAAAILREDGMTDQQIQHMWQNDQTFRSATAQKMLMREAKARIAERSIRGAKFTAVPHVARPGTSEDAVDRSAYADLSREMRGRDLSVKDAAKLLIARRSSR